MVRTKSQINRLVKNYVRELKKRHINPEEILLYGSYAAGTAHPYSDIDILVISKDFKKTNPLNRLEQLSLASIPLNAPIEAIGYTPDEIKKNKNHSIFWDQIKNNLKIIYKSPLFSKPILPQ